MKKSILMLLTVIAVSFKFYWLLPVVIADMLGKLVEERSNGSSK